MFVLAPQLARTDDSGGDYKTEDEHCEAANDQPKVVGAQEADVPAKV